MSRYKGRTSAKETARLYPFVVEVVVPEGGLGRRLDDMLNFAAKAGKPLGGVESYFTIRSYCWIPLQLANGICIDTGKIGESGTPIRKAKYSFHALRHAAASLFIAHLGWTPKRLQAKRSAQWATTHATTKSATTSRGCDGSISSVFTAQ
jgi:hypothetical protein